MSDINVQRVEGTAIAIRGNVSSRWLTSHSSNFGRTG